MTNNPSIELFALHAAQTWQLRGTDRGVFRMGLERFGQLLRRVRIAQGLSQTELSDLLLVSQNSIHRVETYTSGTRYRPQDRTLYPLVQFVRRNT